MGSNDFDHIFKEKLSQASAAPPPHILENLKFDRAARQKLAMAEAKPPAHMWDKISTAIFPKKRVFLTRLRVAAVLLLLSIAGVLFFLPKTNNELSEQSTQTTESKLKPSSQSQAMAMDTPLTPEVERPEAAEQSIQDEPNNQQVSSPDSSPLAAKQDVEPANSDIQTPEPEATDNVAHNAEQNNPLNEAVEQHAISDEPAKQIISEAPKQETVVTPPVQTEPETEPAEVIVEEVAEIEVPVEVVEEEAPEAEAPSTTDTDVTGQMGDPVKGSIKPNPRNIQQFALSLRYAPDVVSVNTQQYYRHGLDLGLNYQNKNLILETGIGGQYSNTNAEYTFNYLDYNHFIGTYDSVVVGGPTSDSTFEIGQSTLVNIYDTVQLSYTERGYEHFVNIRIPLLVGYQKDFRDYSLFVKGGVLYNLNVYQKTSNMNEPGNISELLSFDYPNKHIYKSQIEYMMSVGGNMDLSRNLKLTGEVVGRMSHFGYFRDQRHKGYGVGVRLGLLYEL